MNQPPYSNEDYNASSQSLPPSAMPTGTDFAYTPAWAQDSYIQIEDLLMHFGRQTPVKYIADALRHGRYRPGDPIHPLFTALNQTSANYWRERVVAIWALGRVQLSDQERDATANMLKEILEEKAHLSVWQRFAKGLLWGYGLAIPIALFCSIMVALHDPEPWLEILIQMIMVFGTMASVATVPANLFFGKGRTPHHDNVRQAAAETLGRLGELESIGALAGTLFDPSPLVSEASAQALHLLLPRLSDSHYGLFGEQDMRNLGNALTHNDINLVFKVLDALEKVGTSHAHPYVDRISKTGRTQRIREKALEVLLRLDARIKWGDDSRMLMRPSSSLTSPTGQLLRPAHHSGETEPLQLLRSADSPSDSE